MPDIDIDPITQVYTGIWAMLEGYSSFADTVRPGNRIKYISGPRAPEKPSHQAADFPQVAVFSLGYRPHPEQTTCSSRLTMLWSIEAAVGDRDFSTIGTLDWIIYRALLHWRTYLRPLLWDNQAFVTLFRAKAIDDEIVARRKLRVPDGWSSLWVGECHCHFGTATLKDI